MTIQLTPPGSTPDHQDRGLDPDRPLLHGHSSAHPKRSLLAVFLFVLVAGFLGGPVAGSLESSGRLRHQRRRLGAGHRAHRGRHREVTRLRVSSCCVDTPGGLPADADRVAEVTAALTAEPGIAEVTSPTTTRGSPEETGLVSEDGTQVLVLGTLTWDAEDDTLAESLLDTFEGSGRRGRRWPGRGRLPTRQHHQRGPGPGRSCSRSPS